uniref:Uncharacterized protein n=1 Tax=Ditylenchus dipsaci TaxID=166011 RepID=A0A915EDR0_9BILA
MITENDNTETSEALKRLLLFSGLIFFCTFIILVNKTKVSTNDALTLFPVISLMTIVENGLEPATSSCTPRRSVAPTVFVCRPGSRVVVSSSQNTALNQHQDGNQQTIRYCMHYLVTKPSNEALAYQSHLPGMLLGQYFEPKCETSTLYYCCSSTLQVNELSPSVVNAAQRNALPSDAPPAYDEIENIRSPTTSQTHF